MRKVTSIENGDKLAKIYRHEDEYVVKFYEGGKHLPDADYFTGGLERCQGYG